MRLFAIGLGCLMAWSACAAPVDVKGIRTWPAPDHTRIVLDIDRPVEYALFVLRDPDRVVIDLRDARLLKRVPRGPFRGPPPRAHPRCAAQAFRASGA